MTKASWVVSYTYLAKGNKLCWWLYWRNVMKFYFQVWWKLLSAYTTLFATLVCIFSIIKLRENKLFWIFMIQLFLLALKFCYHDFKKNQEFKLAIGATVGNFEWRFAVVFNSFLKKSRLTGILNILISVFTRFSCSVFLLF